MRILALTLFLIPALAWAQSDLLEQSERPTIAEVLPYHSNYRVEPGIPIAGGNLNFANFAESVRKGAPQFFAKLIKAYPDATFAFLGRDTQAIAEVMDAIFLSNGQRGRVVRVGVSKPTLENLTDAEVVKYLENFGFVLSDATVRRPFIMIDTISKGDMIDNVLISGRQGRRILSAVYSEWIRMGHRPSQLVEKFNMIGMRVSTYKSNNKDNAARYADISTLPTIIQNNKTWMDSGNWPQNKLGNFMALPLINDTPEIFNEVGYDHYTGAWHDKFRPPVTQNGRLVPRPGDLLDINLRKSVVWFQHQIIEIVNDSKFRKNVQKELDDSGAKFEIDTDTKLRSCRKVYR